jgi:hypothetical protein
MKPISFILGISLLANLAMGSYLALSTNPHNGEIAAGGGVSRHAPAATGGVQSGGAQTFWSQLAPDDLHLLKRRLEQSGFPPKLVEAIIKRKVYEKFAARYRAFGGSYFETAHFQNLAVWQSIGVIFNNPEKQAEAGKIYTERVALQSELLGRKSTMETNFDEADKYRLRFLPPETAEALVLLMRDYGAMEMNRGPRSTSSKEERQLLEKEKRKDIEALLSPEQLYECDLHTSRVADALVRDLKRLNPTEEEFRALFPIYRSGVAASGVDPASTELDVNWNKLRDAQKAQIEAVLGPARYADLLQATDPAFSKLNIITQRLGLPLSTAIQVAATQKEIQNRAEGIQNDSTLTAAQRDAHLAALPDEASARITAALGSKGFAAYQEYSGAWLEKLRTPSMPEKR